MAGQLRDRATRLTYAARAPRFPFGYTDIHAFHPYATDDGSEVPDAWGAIPPRSR